MGNITATMDGVGNRTGYILDKWGRVTEIRQADVKSADNTGKIAIAYAPKFRGSISKVAEKMDSKYLRRLLI